MSVEGRRIAVVGAGIFGCTVALALAEAGARVSVFERLREILGGASGNNQNRLHLGFHYPRSIETARQSDRGYGPFVAAFPGAIARGYPNAYFIADEGSRTTAEHYLAFCACLEQPFTPIAPADFTATEVRGCSTGILCDERVYDTALLADAFRTRLAREGGIELCCGADVTTLEATARGYRVVVADGPVAGDFDAVINCAYADINRLSRGLSFAIADNQYEYTAVPIVELDLPPFGATIMDGPFAGLLPWGRTRQFLLYHVVHTVIATEIAPVLDPAWRDPATAPLARCDRASVFATIRDAAAVYLPALRRARLAGFLEGPRMVLKDHDDDDARPSLVTDHGHGYLTVYSGKVVHSVGVAAEVRHRLAIHFGAERARA